VMWGTCAVIGH